MKVGSESVTLVTVSKKESEREECIFVFPTVSL